MAMMRSLGVGCLVTVMAAGLSLCGLPRSSIAQAAGGPMVIAVVDLQVILRDSKAATSARAAIDKQNKAYQAELGKEETTLQSEGQQLEQERAALSADEWQRKKQQFDQKVAAARQTAAARRQQMQQIEIRTFNQVQTALNSTVADVAKARGISLVMIKGAVLYSLPAFDITPEVLQKLDSRLPSVQLAVPK
jgi:outer membrane protein